jgi:3-oxoacyl-[acyl-carrier protein] reductase
MDVNVRAMFLAAKAVVPTMIKQGRGNIINIASIMGERPFILNRICYCSSKTAITSLTLSAAVELGSLGIRVNAIVPGSIATAVGGVPSSPEKYKRFETIIPLRRRGEADDLAGPAIFLASDESDYVSGAILPVDGGWLAGE